MSRTVRVFRHEKAEGTRLDRPQFGNEGGGLTAEGWEGAKQTHRKLEKEGMDFYQPVGVSELLRCRQTAEGFGFVNQVMNPLLNEVNTADPEATQELLDAGIIPDEALAAVRAVLDNPPPEAIWVTHGMLIGGLLQLRESPVPKGFIPRRGDSVEIELPD